MAAPIADDAALTHCIVGGEAGSVASRCRVPGSNLGPFLGRDSSEAE